MGAEGRTCFQVADGAPSAAQAVADALQGLHQALEGGQHRALQLVDLRVQRGQQLCDARHHVLRLHLVVEREGRLLDDGHPLP